MGRAVLWVWGPGTPGSGRCPPLTNGVGGVCGEQALWLSGAQWAAAGRALWFPSQSVDDKHHRLAHPGAKVQHNPLVLKEKMLQI